MRIGDKVLVDGGLKNNYPADLAREMGADIIIGVTVQGEPKIANDMGRTMSILSQIIDVNCKNKYDENLAITDVHVQVDTKGYNAASFSLNAIDTLIRRGEEEGMRHWDEIIALKKRIGIDESFRPLILHPLRPQVMTEKQRVLGYSFENMTPQDERFLRQKFNLKSAERLLNRKDSIDSRLEQELTTSMRMDLFYQTAECRLQPIKLPKPVERDLTHFYEEDKKWKESDGVQVILTAGDKKSMQLPSRSVMSVLIGMDVFSGMSRPNCTAAYSSVS